MKMLMHSKSNLFTTHWSAFRLRDEVNGKNLLGKVKYGSIDLCDKHVSFPMPRDVSEDNFGVTIERGRCRDFVHVLTDSCHGFHSNRISMI